MGRRIPIPLNSPDHDATQVVHLGTAEAEEALDHLDLQDLRLF